MKTAHERWLTQGTVYRYPQRARPESRVIDGLPNYFWHTARPNTPKALLDRGINRLPTVGDGSGGERVPATMLRSSTWKAGSETNPWRDTFDIATSTLTYFGDNRIDPLTGRAKEQDATKRLGNRNLRAVAHMQSSSDELERSNSGPVLIFSGVRSGSRPKGNVRFDGLGLVTRVAIERQTDETTGLDFENLRFDVKLLDLEPEDWQLSWGWISARRSAGSSRDADRLAPSAWQRFTSEGLASTELTALRRAPVEPLSP